MADGSKVSLPKNPMSASTCTVGASSTCWDWPMMVSTSVDCHCSRFGNGDKVPRIHNT